MVNSNTVLEAKNPLAKNYSLFGVEDRVLLTGHSHQAWPDCAFDGQKQAYQDAAEFVDEKWSRAFIQAEKVKTGFARLLNVSSQEIVLGANTHELLLRVLSALSWSSKKRIVTTDGEFHSARRQFHRLEEEGFEVIRVPVNPRDTFGERLAKELTPSTNLLFASSVFFETGWINPFLKDWANLCDRNNITFLIDAYHSLNVVPWIQDGLESALIIGGGYKYCQLGEGCCFLRVPEGKEWRPLITGWFAEFSELNQTKTAKQTAYPSGSASWAGSTYDPTSHYRGARVFDFFSRESLTPNQLREMSQKQMEFLIQGFNKLTLPETLISMDRSLSLKERAGFLSLRTKFAQGLSEELRRQNIWTDYRGEFLRLGPAPYLNGPQLHTALTALEEAVKTLPRV